MNNTTDTRGRLDTDHLRRVAQEHGSETLRQIAEALDALRPLFDRGIKAPHRYVQGLKEAGFWATSKREGYGHRHIETRFHRDADHPGRYHYGREITVYHAEGPDLVPELENRAASELRYLEKASRPAEHVDYYLGRIQRLLMDEGRRAEEVDTTSVREAKLTAIEQIRAALDGLDATTKEAP